MTTTVYFEKNGGIDIELRGARKVLSLRKHIKIDPENLESVQLVSDMKKPKFYKKVAGTNAWYYGGWFRENGENEFWDVRNNERVLVITTRNSKYKKLYIEVGPDFRLTPSKP